MGIPHPVGAAIVDDPGVDDILFVFQGDVSGVLCPGRAGDAWNSGNTARARQAMMVMANTLLNWFIAMLS
jgi:hypothetical protein